MTTIQRPKIVYAKVFGPSYGKAKPQKLYYTTDGKYTSCGLACYAPGKEATQTPWTDVCGRCAKIGGVK